MNIPFSLTELCITNNDLPLDIADKLLKYHITPMVAVRKALNAPITASLKSGYRPVEYEKSKGRSGNSQHTFQGKGAIDWTAADLDKLEKLIIKHTDYTRIARYNSFIHCDYKPTADGKRQYFTSGADSRWVFVKNVG